ncbi:hypothetical protein LCGC14_0732110 [marine sediment metagenome]|uniref:Uncharacterized protein n=1 Tax=marine sediment metagenome TaxID=412755 RepID=A0A0F9Q9B0_9ZZZZ
MKQRKLYYSRKRKRIIIEGVITKYGKTNTIHIITLPDPLKLIESWNIPFKKLQKILEKINRVDFKSESRKNKG